MKKICAIFMAAAMLLTLCACNIKDVTKIVSVGAEAIEKGEFNFYLLQAKNQTVSKAQQDGQTLSVDSPAEAWDSVMIDGKSAKQYALDLAKDSAKQDLVLKAKAVAEGITLTEEDKESIKSERQNLITQFGGRYAYEQQFSAAGFTLEDAEKIITNKIYANKLMQKYLSEEIEVPDDEADASAETAGEEAKEEDKEDKETSDAEEEKETEKDEEAKKAETDETEDAAETTGETAQTEKAVKKIENPDAIKVSDEDALEAYNKDYVYVKHILISNTKTEETAPEETAAADEEAVDEEAASEEVTLDEAEAPAEEETESSEELDAAAKAKAEALIAQIEGGADFDKLMKENSDDKNSETGEVNGLEGYVFTKGQMVPEFEEAAYALEVGGLTKEPVKTDYGYHIIKRLELPNSGELFDNAVEDAKAKVKSDIWDSMIEQWAEEFGISFNEKAISKIKF